MNDRTRKVKEKWDSFIAAGSMPDDEFWKLAQLMQEAIDNLVKKREPAEPMRGR